MEKLLDQLANGIAQGSTRRGFLAGALRWAVGLGMGAAFLATGRAVWAKPAAIGCAPGPDVQTGRTACAKPAGPGNYGYKDNCHWDDPGRTWGDSDKYGCRARRADPPDPLDRPYCKDLNPPVTCRDQTSGSGPPSCPSGAGWSDKGYWACCCDLSKPNQGEGKKGSTLTYCLDCDHTDGRKCICLKVVPNAQACQ